MVKVKEHVVSLNRCLSLSIRPEILKHEMKVFFVKYNDPIYVKLEKLDIMIRLASQANIAQVRGCLTLLEGPPRGQTGGSSPAGGRFAHEIVAPALQAADRSSCSPQSASAGSLPRVSGGFSCCQASCHVPCGRCWQS